MSNEQDPSDDQIQQEMRAQQKFTMAGAIGRAGSGLMKGASPVSQQEQLITELMQWLEQHTVDPSGALKSILTRRLQSNELLVERHLNQPLAALRELIEAILASDYALHEFVRQVDVRWGELYQERPLFQRSGQAADPADEYSHQSVHRDLTALLEKLP